MGYAQNPYYYADPNAAAFVGAFTSQAFRLAYELGVARKGFAAPFVSVDVAWCFTGLRTEHAVAREGTLWHGPNGERMGC